MTGVEIGCQFAGAAGQAARQELAQAVRQGAFLPKAADEVRGDPVRERVGHGMDRAAPSLRLAGTDLGAAEPRPCAECAWCDMSGGEAPPRTVLAVCRTIRSIFWWMVGAVAVGMQEGLVVELREMTARDGRAGRVDWSGACTAGDCAGG